MGFQTVNCKKQIKEVGLYTIIGNDGLFWGNYRAVINWCGEFLILHCDKYGQVY